MKIGNLPSWIPTSKKVIQWVWQASPAKVCWEFSLKVSQSVLDTVATVWMLYYIMDLIGSGGSFSELVLRLTALLALQLTLSFLRHWFEDCQKEQYDYTLFQYMQQMLMKKAQAIGLRHYDDPVSYDFMARAQTCANETVEAAFRNMVNTAGFLGMLFSSAVMIWQIDKWLFCLGLFAFPAVWLTRRFNSLRYQFRKSIIPARRRQEYVKKTFLQRDFAQEIRLTRISRVLRRQAKQASKEIKDQVHRQWRRLAVYQFLFNQFYINLIMVTCYVYALLRLLLFHSLEIPEFSVMLVAVTSFTSRLWRIFSSVETAQAHSFVIQDFLEFLALPVPEEGGIEPGKITEIILKDVSFRYPDSKKDALSHLNLHIRGGEKIVLAGYNGAGKSTLVKLLLGFYEPSAGGIICNGLALNQLDRAKYRQRFGVLFQDFQIYQTTIAENILLRSYDPAADSASVWEALGRCGLAARVESLPKKEQTYLSCEFEPDGVIFSGGEQQKLAIARLWAQDYDVAILDEPSSALDPIAESEMMERIFEAAAGKTLILISHRLSSALWADRVVFLENGQIMEEGSHTELMEKEGKYAEYFALQAEKYRN